LDEAIFCADFVHQNDQTILTSADKGQKDTVH
jgi:hypothetical protein